jgi:hypothetical protein
MRQASFAKRIRPPAGLADSVNQGARYGLGKGA